MQTKTRASAVKIYLFFLFISLLAVSGCGLDIDFGGGNGNDNVKKNEIIMGFIKEIPDIDEGSTLVVKAYVVDETVACCEYTTSIGSSFYIEGNLDPKAELQILESGNEDPPLGTITVPVFPGATVDIQDISIDERVLNFDYINVGFEGQVASKSCFSETSKTGSIKVQISSEGSETEVTVNLTRGTDIERDDEQNLPCEEIVEGRKVKVDGKLLIGNTVEAGLVEIL